MSAAHNDVGHHGFFATNALITERYWWPHIGNDTGQPNPTGSRVRVSLGLGAGHGESTHDPGPTHLKGNSQRRPTAANEGQCRPTKTKKGPNDARRVVWSIGRSFFSMYILFFID